MAASPVTTDRTTTKPRTWYGGILAMILVAVLFFFSYTQSPLYSSNQNTYLVRGLAQGGLGLLTEDWYANTTEPFPLVGGLTTLTYRHGHEYMFFAYVVILGGIYMVSLAAVVAHVRRDFGWRSFYAFLALFTLLHAWWINQRYLEKVLPVLLPKVEAVTWLSPTADYLRALAPRLVDGVAGQYILGPQFQPSMFGVLLLTSIYLYLRERPIWAVVLSGLAATFHPTYLLAAAALTAAYMLDMVIREGAWRRALLVGGVALLVVAPVLAYSLIQFPQTTPLAEQILATKRIPHHAIVSEWWGPEAILRIVIIGVGILLVRRTRLLWLMVVPTAISVLLTLLRIWTGSYTLALLFPWRLSVFLVPLSLAVFFAYFVRGVGHLLRGVPAWLKTVGVVGLWGLVLVSAWFGYERMAGSMAWRENRRQSGAFYYITKHLEPGQIYLVPINMQDFRLDTGAPILADWKSHPYRDDEFLQWYTRVERARAFYNASPSLRPSILEDIVSRWEVTHILMPSKQCDLPRDLAYEIYEDQQYCVYKLR